MSAGSKIVLASASPRRRSLLRDAGLEFEVDPADVDEELAAGTSPVAGARALAERKARAVAARRPRPCWVLGADTVVAVEDGQGAWLLLGKPGSPAEAAGMLGRLSGTRHQVVTGVCVVRSSESGPERAWVDAETTWVSMRPLAPAEIEAYVLSGEWRDKAGGYAIQEQAERFVTALEGGGFDNVVGLPVGLALAMLRAAGAPESAFRGPRLVRGTGAS